MFRVQGWLRLFVCFKVLARGCLRFRVEGVWDLGLRVSGSSFFVLRIKAVGDLGFIGLRVLGVYIEGSGLRVYDFGFRVVGAWG